MRHRSTTASLVLLLSACAPPPPPSPDAQPDAAPEAAADAQNTPDAEPAMDARADVDAAALPDAQPEASSPDAADAGSTPDARADASARPDINTMQPTMALNVLMRRTCGAGFTERCDEVQSQTFEASCSVRGARFNIYFLPCARGLTQCGEVFSNIEGAFTSIAATSSIGGAPAQGSEAFLTPGLEWVDGMGQRRQNFYVRARLAPSTSGIRGIAGVAGQTALPEFADFYALACPKGP